MATVAAGMITHQVQSRWLQRGVKVSMPATMFWRVNRQDDQTDAGEQVMPTGLTPVLAADCNRLIRMGSDEAVSAVFKNWCDGIKKAAKDRDMCSRGQNLHHIVRHPPELRIKQHGLVMQYQTSTATPARFRPRSI